MKLVRIIINNGRFKQVAYSMLTIIIIVISYFVYMDEWSNFHTVIKGKVYRSAIMDWDELEHFVAGNGIKTMINLTGEHPDSAWYQEELEFCRIYSIKHIDIKFPQSRKPATAKMHELTAIFDSATLPLLIHCRAGADRTGLACAIWLYSVEGLSAKASSCQLSWRFGHLPMFGTRAMDDTFNQWVEQHPPKSIARN